MREDRSDEVDTDEYEEDECERELPTHDIFVELIDMGVFLEAIGGESHDDEESKIDEYTIPDDSEGTDHEDKSIDTHKHHDLLQFSIRFLLLLLLLYKKMYTSQKYETHPQDNGVSESIPETNSVEVVCYHPIGSWEKVVETHDNQEYEWEDSEDILAWSDEQEKWGNKSEKNIGYFREFPGLVLLESEVSRELEIVVDARIIAKVSSKICILRLATGCNSSSGFIFYDFQLFFGLELFVVIESGTSRSSEERIHTDRPSFAIIFHIPWHQGESKSEEKYKIGNHPWSEYRYIFRIL